MGSNSLLDLACEATCRGGVTDFLGVRCGARDGCPPGLELDLDLACPSSFSCIAADFWSCSCGLVWGLCCGLCCFCEGVRGAIAFAVLGVLCFSLFVMSATVELDEGVESLLEVLVG